MLGEWQKTRLVQVLVVALFVGVVVWQSNVLRHHRRGHRGGHHLPGLWRAHHDAPGESAPVVDSWAFPGVCSHCEDVRQVVQRLGAHTVICYGYRQPESTHTDSYVMYAIYRAMRYVFAGTDVRVVWLDDRDDDAALEVRLGPAAFKEYKHGPGNGLLFITWINVPYVDERIALHKRAAGYIIFTEADKRSWRYSWWLDRCRAIQVNVYGSSSGLPTPSFQPVIADGHPVPLHWVSREYRRFILPWATNLTPTEVARNRAVMQQKYAQGDHKDHRGGAVFVGSVWERNKEEFLEFVAASRRSGLEVGQFGNYCIMDDAEIAAAGFNHYPSVSDESNERLVQEAFIAPAIQGVGQVSHHDEHGTVFPYVPCRLFKNLSYGAMGITNNPGAQELFDNDLIFSSNITQLIEQAVREIPTIPWARLERLMKKVEEHHTYVNRLLQVMLAFEDIRQHCPPIPTDRLDIW